MGRTIAHRVRIQLAEPRASSAAPNAVLCGAAATATQLQLATHDPNKRDQLLPLSAPQARQVKILCALPRVWQLDAAKSNHSIAVHGSKGPPSMLLKHLPPPLPMPPAGPPPPPAAATAAAVAAAHLPWHSCTRRHSSWTTLRCGGCWVLDAGCGHDRHMPGRHSCATQQCCSHTLPCCSAVAGSS